jgi:hypothetical protein
MKLVIKSIRAGMQQNIFSEIRNYCSYWTSLFQGGLMTITAQLLWLHKMLPCSLLGTRVALKCDIFITAIIITTKLSTLDLTWTQLSQKAVRGRRL